MKLKYYKNKLFLSISFLLFAITLQSQTKILDSLKLVLETHQKKDTTKVILYNSLAIANSEINIEKTKFYALKANKTAKEINYIEGEASSLFFLAIYAYKTKDFENAINQSKEAIKLASKINDSISLLENHQFIAAVYKDKNNTKEAVYYYNKALVIAQKINHKSQEGFLFTKLGDIFAPNDYNKSINYFIKAIEAYRSINEEKEITLPLNNLSSIYSKQGRFLEAIECLRECIEINKKLNREDQCAINYINIGSLYSDLEQKQKGISYIEKAVDYYKKNNVIYNLTLCYINIGNIYEDDKKLDLAEEYYNKAISTANGITDNAILYYCHSNIAHLNYELKRYDIALENYKKSLSVVDSFKNDFFKCELYSEIAKLYLARKEYTEAFNYALDAKKIAYELDLTEQQKETHETLSKLYQIKGNYKKAYKNQLHFKTLSDSLFNEESIEKLTQLEYEYKYKQKIESANERETSLIKKVKTTNDDLEKSQKKIFIGIILFLTTVIFSLAGLFFLRIKNIKAKNETVLTEQKLLRSQMTPHFIFNSLAVLQGIIVNKEEKKSISYLSKFSKLLRIMLENSRDSIVSLSDELKAIENYLALQNIKNTQNPFAYTILIDDSVKKHDFSIPPMLIQPFIENAIEHAFADKKENKKIDISLQFKNSELTCIICDNGIGIDSYKKERKQENKKSLATKITSERLDIFSKKYNNKGSLNIEDRKHHGEKGTIVTLIIPYKIIKNDD